MHRLFKRHLSRGAARTGLAFSLAVTGGMIFASSPRTLTFEERVKAQEAIERFHFNHRI